MDASFLYIESKQMPQHVLGLMLLDAGAPESQYSYQRFRQVLLERAHLLPAFQRRLVTVPLALDHPYWAQVSDFDVDEHLHLVTCPAPGDTRAVGRIVGDIAAEPLDRSRPLFGIWLVEGLADGKVAMVAKMHHSTLYGAAGADMMAQLLDFGPEGREVEPAPDVPDDDIPSTVSLLGHAALNTARRPVRAARTMAQGMRRLGRMGGMVGRSITSKSPVALPFSAPKSLLNGALTASREVAFVRTSFADVKEIRTAFGTKVNDVVLAATTYALRNYLVARDALPKRPLVASVPMNVGAGDVAGTDKLSALLVPLPIDTADPVEQLERCAEFSRRSKGMVDALGTEMVADVAEVIPPMLVVAGSWLYDQSKLSGMHPPMQTLIVSNMPGPPIELWCAGAKVEAVYPFGPLLPGTGLNVTVLSNMGNLDVGLLCCPDLVPDIWEIAEAIPAAVQLLVDAARARA
jgi:WS/DGAT/MGAT family acyltransferase